MTNTPDKKLLPCPFCGSVPTLMYGETECYIQCTACDCEFGKHVYCGVDGERYNDGYFSKEQALEKWNTRTNPNNAELVATLKLWLKYDESDMSSTDCMINYAEALEATKQALSPQGNKMGGE